MGKKGKNFEPEDDEEEEDDEDFDDEEDDLEDEEEDDAPRKKTAGKKRKGSEFFDEAAEEDDEEDDEDEDEGGKDHRKKRSVFIDDIADVDDDDEEDDFDEEAEDLIDDRDLDVPDASGPGPSQNYRLLNREINPDEKTEEELARYIEERYKSYDEQGDDEGPVEGGVVGQQGLLPTINDPKLWVVTCRPGMERQACVQLLHKYYNCHERGAPMLIKSAVALDHLKGFVYVEAEKEAHVRDAIRGLRTMFSSKGVKLVPLTEMTEAITVNRKAKLSLSRDSYVRVRMGVYKDDLAKVVEVDFAAQRAVIRLLPRLDLQAMANRDEETRRKFPFGRQPTVRPPSKPFNAEEARQLSLIVSRTQGNDGVPVLLLGSHRFVDGYLEKSVAIKGLTPVDGMVPLDEMAKYNAGQAQSSDQHGMGGGGGGSDLSAVMKNLPLDGSTMQKAQFAKGDKVVIIRGELQNLEASVTDVREDGKVMVRPHIDGFFEVVDFNADELRKLFKVGDRVKVLAGQHTGETGLLLSIKEEACVMLSETTRQELKVFARDLTEAVGESTGIEVLGSYQLHDLVQLDQTTAGVIIRIDKDAARVLTGNGSLEQPELRICRLADMQRKVFTKNIITTDCYQNQIRVGDYAIIKEGPANMRNKGGTVEYIWRGTLFIKSPDLTDVGGYAAVRARSTMLRGGLKSATDLARGTPSRTPTQNPAAGMQSVLRSPMHHSGGGLVESSLGGPRALGTIRPAPPRAGGGGGPPGSFSGGRGPGGPQNTLVGKMVRVVGGNYHSYRGRVKNETGTHAQLELDAINRVVTVKRDQLKVEGALGGGGPGGDGGRGGGGGNWGSQDNSQGGRFGNGGGRGGGSQGGYGASQDSQRPGDPGYTARAPTQGSQTPMHHFGSGQATPAHPSMTPMHAPYTPMHSANTPMLDDNYGMLGGGPSGGGGGAGGSYYDDLDDGLRRSGSAGAGLGGGGRYSGMDQRSHPSHPSNNMTAATPGLHAYTPAMTPSGYGEEGPAPTPNDGGYGGGPMHGHPGHHSGHPGAGMAAGTPGLAPTPGLASTPYISAPTPAITPGLDGVAPTPGGYGFTGNTPGVAPTPGVPHYTPALTPGVANTPGTPGMADHHGAPANLSSGTSGGEDLNLWMDIVVRIPGGGMGVVRDVGSGDGMLLVQPGTISGSAPATLTPDGAECWIQRSELSLVPPQKKDRVRLLRDSETAIPTGKTGVMIGIDGPDGIVKCDGSGSDMQIFNMSLLGKLATLVTPR